MTKITSEENKRAITFYRTMKCSKNKPRIIMVPYSAQGHVTPMLNLASALSHHGFSPVVVTPEFIHRSIAPKTNVTCMSIPDGLDEETPRDFFSIEFAMENNMPKHLESLVHNLSGGGGGIACMIVDVLASWAFKVGDDCGVPVVGYWPVMFAAYQLIAAIPELLSLGIISETGIPQNEGPVCLENGQPILSTEDLPWLIGDLAAKKSRFKFWTRTLDRVKSLQKILVNTFPVEHCADIHQQNQSITNVHQSYQRIIPVGPLMEHTLSKNPSFWDEDRTCLDWLDKQSYSSVVYISFGSWVSPIGEAKVRNLAMALETSRRPFILVLGPKWREGLPGGYVERMLDQGRVVSWAPQVDVLRHKAVGCFLTHCGWSSTLEAIQNKVRLLCYPIAGDQFVNCKYIVEVWKIGIRVKDFVKEDIEGSLRMVMEDAEIEQRLAKVNERIFGSETSLRVNNNLTMFLEDLDKTKTESIIRDN